MPLPATVNLSTLTGQTGLKIPGLSAIDQLGTNVLVADLNGDGFADLIVSGQGVNSYAGAAYVVLGGAAGLPAPIDLAGLDGTNGFTFRGGNRIGVSMTAGDLNGDGLLDLVVTGPSGGGQASIIFGRSGSGPAGLNSGGLDGVNGANFTSASAGIGYSAQAAGDINGDGVSDLLISNIAAGTGNGAVYVVFGKTSGWTANVNLDALDGVAGFRIDGAANEAAGTSMAAIDLNGDGFDDLVIGARLNDAGGSDSGGAYIVFGKASGWSAAQSVTAPGGVFMSVSGTNLFMGNRISNLGDINGDGIDDVGIAGSGSNTAYVVFGKTTAWANSLDLAALDGTEGFKLVSDSGVSQLISVGDVNNDGYRDLMVGGPTRNGSVGGAHVLFGRAGGWSASESLVNLDGVRGFTIRGEMAGDLTGRAVAGGYDLNGDGIDDIVLGAIGQDQGGNFSGAVYIVYGQQGAINRVGTAAAETLNGASEGDTLSGLAGQDILQGLAGDDLLDGGANADVLFGGDGADDLIGGTGGDVLWGGTGDDGLDGGADGDKLYGEDGSDLLLGGDGNDQLFGGAGIDTLTGGAGNDTLDGGGQADILVGGAGNDIYIVNNAGVTITELAGGGYDIVRASISLTLGAELEALQLQGAGDLDGTGNGLANNLQGNSGANVLSGGAGVDTINGNDGADRIIGGEGNDLLRGGLGADVFVVSHAFGSVLETDQVYDFSDAEGDLIDLSGAFAGVIREVDAFTRTAGEMTLSFAAGLTTLRLDVNGDGKVDYQMKINGDVTGHATAWLL